uniref:Uncharacterized protein n=1 Tax=Rhodnius prolixus TaxID=13249 RepID=T1HTN1_RHOPR
MVKIDTELLEQEEAYHKLNAELELKTRQLMKDVEAVMNKRSNPKLWAQEDLYKEDNNYDFYSPISEISSDPLEYSCYRSQCRPSNGYPTAKKSIRKNNPLHSSSSNIYKNSLENDDIVPASAKGLSSESLVRFLKAKVKIAQEELANAKREYTLRTDEWRKLQIELKSYDEEKLKLTGDLASARDKIKKQELTIATLTERLSLRDSENNLLKNVLI